MAILRWSLWPRMHTAHFLWLAKKSKAHSLLPQKMPQWASNINALYGRFYMHKSLFNVCLLAKHRKQQWRHYEYPLTDRTELAWHGTRLAGTSCMTSPRCLLPLPGNEQVRCMISAFGMERGDFFRLLCILDHFYNHSQSQWWYNMPLQSLPAKSF